MVKRIFLKKVLIAVCFFVFSAVLNSCQTKEEKILGKAIGCYQHNQSDLGLEKVDFQGPVLKSRIENFAPNPNYLIYGWYFIHEKDTFWIYSKVDKKLIKETSVHFSSNFDELRKDYVNWESK